MSAIQNDLYLLKNNALSDLSDTTIKFSFSLKILKGTPDSLSVLFYPL